MENIQVNEEKNPSGVESESPANRAGQASLWIACEVSMHQKCAAVMSYKQRDYKCTCACHAEVS